MAEIEELQTYEQFGQIRINNVDGDDYYFNPLENADQFLTLFEKHEVERTYQPYDFIGWSYGVLNGKNRALISEWQGYNDETKPDFSMKKAGCLAILLNKSPRFMFPDPEL